MFMKVGQKVKYNKFPDREFEVIRQNPNGTYVIKSGVSKLTVLDAKEKEIELC